MKKISLSLLATFLFLFSQAQVNQLQSNTILQEECKTDIIMQEQLANDTSFAKKIAKYKKIAKQLSNQKMATLYTIPIVVHVIHLGEPEGTGSNISDAQIHSAINNLNQAYRNQAPYTGLDMELEFCLASVNPSGQPTSGINRVNGSGVSDYAINGITNDVGSSQNEVAVKALSNWGNTDYYQFWIVAGIDGNMGGGGVQGYAYFTQAASKDGAVVLYNSFGYDPTGSLCYNLKSYTNRNVTTIHEIGHALGLYHTFQGDNGGGTCPSTNPSLGDEVADTPAHKRSGSGDACNSTAANTCDPAFGTGTQQDHIHNFMDYSGDACQTEFTSGQKTKARAWLLAARSSLTTSTKCTPVAVPVSEFTTQCGAQSGCAGSSISFFDLSEHNPTSWSWSFPGGTPSSSNSQYPTIVYNTPGTYAVTLTASNSSGAGNTETKSGFITIYNSPTSACTGQASTNEGGFGYTISKVEFNTLSNSTSSSSNTAYTDFSCSHTTQVVAGASHNLSITANAGTFNQGGLDFRVFVDWDGDGTFAVGEEIPFSTSSVSEGNSVVSTESVTVPLTAQTGNLLRLRVISDAGVATPSGACDMNLFIGEVEDYGIYVNAAGLAPDAEFSGTPTTLCEGNSVAFTDLSTNTPTSWSWSFPGGTPSTSTSQNPTVTYNTAGTYQVQLTATNASGSNVETKINYITVNSCGITKLRDSDCGLTMTSYTNYVQCDYVPGATEYEYEFVNAGLAYTQTYTRSNPYYRFVYLHNVPGILDNTTYDVRVRAKVGGSYGAFGPVCQLTTPPSSVRTKLRDSDCGLVMTSYNNYIKCDYVSNATEYEYEFVNAGLGYTQTYVRPNINYRHVYVNNVPGILDNTTYDVRVRAKVNGVYTAYGSICQITTPAGVTTKLRNSDCGSTMTSYSNYITCDYVSGATEYEYEFVNAGLGYNQTYRRGNPNYRFMYVDSLPGIQLSTTYDVRVRVKVNGSYTPFGPICQLTTPATARLVNPNEHDLLSNNDLVTQKIDLIIYPNPNQGNYLYVELKGVSTITEIVVTDISGKIVQNQNIGLVNNSYYNTIKFDKTLEPGFYFVSVISGNSTVTKKLIVK